MECRDQRSVTQCDGARMKVDRERETWAKNEEVVKSYKVTENYKAMDSAEDQRE